MGGLHPCAAWVGGATLKRGCPFLAAVSYPNLAQKNFLVPMQAVCGRALAGLLTAVWVGCIPVCAVSGVGKPGFQQLCVL